MTTDLPALHCQRPPHSTSLRCVTLASFLFLASNYVHALDGADAQLFVDSAQAATGTCFPKYHLELWDKNVPRKWADRRSTTTDISPACSADDDYWSRLRTYFRTAHAGAPDQGGDWRPPRLVVTLEGGGSKSAPFSLGALAGLHESGLLADVEIISSVSGGTYAAYFYFSRLLDAQNGVAAAGARDPNAWFKDCIPSIYRRRFADSAISTAKFCSGPDARSDHMEVFAHDYPYQAHVRFYQDLVHWKGGLERVDQNSADAFSTYTNVAFQLVQHVATVPLHALKNSVFAMPESTSPSRFAYRAGIERAYAHTLGSWNGASNGQAEPTGGSFSERVYQRGYSMRDLAPVVGSDPCKPGGTPCKVPLWIANAAASSGRDLSTWISVPSTDALRASFEMSPFGQGSGTYGFLNQPVDIPLRDVVGSSAAFFDRDQREFGLGAVRLAIGAGISLLNLEWGSDIRNFNTPDKSRALAHITPLPLYHVPAESQRYSPTIHLADGGNTDNLGVLAALRRGASNIIVVAATGDGTGRMTSLCRAKNHLELDGAYRVDMPELVDLDRVCSEQIGERELVVFGEPAIVNLVCERRKLEKFCTNVNGSIRWIPKREKSTGYDMWSWPIPVLRGAVVRNQGDGVPEKLISEIYLVKPAIYQQEALKQVAHTTGGVMPGRLCDLDYSHLVNRCTAATTRQAEGTGINQPVAMPCTAIAFSLANRCHDGETHGTFPQHDVVFTTLNSSYTLFGAYYDLARHVVSQLGWDTQRRSLTVPCSLGAKRIWPTGSQPAPTTSISLAGEGPSLILCSRES